MARVFLVRHAEPKAAWGGGEADPGLSALGKTQAAAAASALREHGALAVLSSPMRRCRETAAPFAGAAVAIEPRVSEVAAPEDVRDRQAWLLQNFPWRGGAPARRWRDLDADLHRWRGDVLAALAAIDADSVVFTHFIAINAIIGAALGREDTIVCRPAHASITELSCEDGRLRLLTMGAEMAGGEVR